MSIAFCLLIWGCSSSEDKVCSHYGDLEARCSDFPKGEHSDVRKMAAGFCERAQQGDDILELGAEIQCSKEHKDCAAYNKCKEALNQ